MKLVMVLATLLSGVAMAEEGAFDITVLPHGKSVTLPRPATTLVPMETVYSLNPTDKHQVFRISAPQTGCAISLQFYDKSGSQVRTHTLRSGESMIYHFTRLHGVRIETSSTSKCVSTAKLVVDSNRPMEVAL